MTPRCRLSVLVRRASGALVLLLLLMIVRPAQALPPSSGEQSTPATPATPAPPAVAPAAPPALTEPPVAITVSGTCPNAEAIWAAVASIVPAKDLDRFAAAAKVEVFDLGDSYRVSVNAKGIDRLRVYRDLAHDCDHRARFAAVFVVLTLMPPDVLLDVLPAQPPPPPPPPPLVATPIVRPIPAPVPAPPPRAHIEISGLFDAAPPLFSAPRAFAFGGEVRMAVRAGQLALMVAAGFETIAPPLQIGGLTVSEYRLPFDVGLRLPLATRPSAALVAELGMGAALFHARGTNSADPQAGTRLDLGARAGVAVHLGAPRDRVQEIAGIHVDAFPKPYDVTLTPQGMVGRTPALWIGATLGLAVRP